MSAQPSSPSGAANLTDVAIGKVFACVSVGASLKDAADYVAIPISDILARRRTDAQFASGLRQATRQGKVHHLNKISKSPSWQASAWVLERRWRKQFGRNEPRNPQAADKAEVYDWRRLNLKQQRQVIRLLGLALLTRAEANRVHEVRAADGDPRPSADSASGSDRGGAVPEQPA